VSPGRRKAGLEALLLAHQGLWRPQPFKEETPAWCQTHAALASELLALTEAEVERLKGDNIALIELSARHVPALAELAKLIDLPYAPQLPTTPGNTREDERFFRDIPGRKRAQIEDYAAALGQPAAPILEWCAGKGHLGRLLAERWQVDVQSLEIDPALCADGAALAHHAGLSQSQHFIAADALAADSSDHLPGRHAVALHACGDLHRTLITGAAAQASPAIDLAPCCYYRTRDLTYRPLSGGSLALTRDDLRLAVTDTATASALERRRSRQALAWKLAWVALRQRLTGEAYRPFKPVPETWMKAGFDVFLRRLAEREMLPLPGDLDLDTVEASGYQRLARVRRLELARLAFRRALEVWLVMDMACFLEDQGYVVTVSRFCSYERTPRNLLLSARRASMVP
jgi:hypothetical protein